MKERAIQFFNTVDFFIFEHTDIMPGVRDYLIATTFGVIVLGMVLYSFLTRKKGKLYIQFTNCDCLYEVADIVSPTVLKYGKRVKI